MTRQQIEEIEDLRNRVILLERKVARERMRYYKARRIRDEIATRNDALEIIVDRLRRAS